MKRYIRAWKIFLILCQNCAAFITVKSVLLFLQLCLDSSSSSSRQRIAFICPCVERGVEHAAALHPSLWSYPTNPPTPLIPSTAGFVEGVSYLFSLGFLLPWRLLSIEYCRWLSCFSMNFLWISNPCEISDLTYKTKHIIARSCYRIQMISAWVSLVISCYFLIPNLTIFLKIIFLCFTFEFLALVIPKRRDKKHRSSDWKEVPK